MKSLLPYVIIISTVFLKRVGYTSANSFLTEEPTDLLLFLAYLIIFWLLRD